MASACSSTVKDDLQTTIDDGVYADDDDYDAYFDRD